MNKLYLDTSFNKNVSAEILNPDSLKFENGLAVVHVKVVDSHPPYNVEHSTYTIINEKTNENGEYIILDPYVNDELLPAFVNDIKRFGNHFFYDIYTNDERTDSCYYHCEYIEKDEELVAIGKVNKMPEGTKNPDMVIINSQLYSLSKHEFTTRKYSSIEDIDGETFFVCDEVTNSEKNLTDHLLFDIDVNDERKSKIYSRNQRDFLKSTTDMPYESVLELVKNELNITIKSEELHRAYLMKKQNEEQ